MRWSVGLGPLGGETLDCHLETKRKRLILSVSLALRRWTGNHLPYRLILSVRVALCRWTANYLSYLLCLHIRCLGL
jgi:hypothetical protein